MLTSASVHGLLAMDSRYRAGRIHVMETVAAIAAICCAVSGIVHTPSGAPIVDARVAVGSEPAVRADATGHFAVRVARGAGRIVVTANGFGAMTIDRIDLHDGTAIDVMLEPLAPGSLRTIGSVVVDGMLALRHDAIPYLALSRATIDSLGMQRVPDALAQISSLTLPRPDSGAASAVSVAALRGPDPSETLIALDGQVLNNASTGSLDLSQFPISPFRSIEITEGLGPEDASGSNTIGGEINLRSLAPTRAPHAFVAVTYGALGTFSVVANATGSDRHLGYALALGNATSDGPITSRPATFASVAGTTTSERLGGAVATRTALVTTTWDFTQRASLRVRYFTIGNIRDQSAALNGVLPDGTFSGPGRANVTQGLRAIAISGRMPIGSGTLTASYEGSGTTSTYDGGPTMSPYDTSSNDRLGTYAIGYARSGPVVDFSVGGFTRNESLAIERPLAYMQNEHSSAYFARAAVHVTSKLRVLGAISHARYSTFGVSTDGRLGAVLDLDGRSDLRASIGTGFRAPLLGERYVTPLAELAAGLPGSVDANCVAANGNANEKAEHVTEYELGYGRRFGATTVTDLTLYRTNLRGPIEIAYPLEAACPANAPGSMVAGQAMPINIGNAVYQGGSFRLARGFGALFAHLDYGINVAYPLDLPQSVANPSSGANLVTHHQFEGIPVHVVSLGAEYRRSGNHVALAATYRGRNNELNAGAYAIVDGAFGKQIGALDYTVGITNLTNANAAPFTKIGTGVPYPGGSGPLATNRYALQPAAISLIISLRR